EPGQVLNRGDGHTVDEDGVLRTDPPHRPGGDDCVDSLSAAEDVGDMAERAADRGCGVVGEVDGDAVGVSGVGGGPEVEEAGAAGFDGRAVDAAGDAAAGAEGEGIVEVAAGDRTDVAEGVIGGRAAVIIGGEFAAVGAGDGEEVVGPVGCVQVDRA